MSNNQESDDQRITRLDQQVRELVRQTFQGAEPGRYYVEEGEQCWELYLEMRNPEALGEHLHPLKVIKAPKDSKRAACYWPGAAEGELIELALNRAPLLAEQAQGLAGTCTALERGLADALEQRDKAELVGDALQRSIEPWMREAYEQVTRAWSEVSSITAERDELRTQLVQERLHIEEYRATVEELREEKTAQVPMIQSFAELGHQTVKLVVSSQVMLDLLLDALPYVERGGDAMALRIARRMVEVVAELHGEDKPAQVAE
jgi:hypothetical protein